MRRRRIYPFLFSDCPKHAYEGNKARYGLRMKGAIEMRRMVRHARGFVTGMQEVNQVTKQMTPEKRYSQRRLERFVTETVSLAEDLCPDAGVWIKIPCYEELSAFVEVIVPDEMDDEVSDRLHERTSQIFDEENYWLSLHVVERSLRQKPKQQGG
jgi:hypothetical protein